MSTRSRRTIKPTRVILYMILVVAAVFFLVPVYILLVTSLKSYADVNLATMWALPRHLSLDSFISAWNGDPSKGTIGLSNNFLNSLKLTVPAALFAALVGSLNGYVLAKWKFPGSNFIFALILFGMFIPYQSILIPLMLTLQSWGKAFRPLLDNVEAWQIPFYLEWVRGLIQTYIPAYGTIGGLGLVHVIYGIPITTLIFRNYYAEIPDELLEAGKIDGAGFWGLYRFVLFPLSVPGFVVVIIWEFQSIWNEFLFAVVLTNNAASQPITVALNNLAGSYIVEWNVQMAGALLAALPTLLIFIILGRYFMRGLLAGSLKG
jgi:glucose/mannose transport system permease protein